MTLVVCVCSASTVMTANGSGSRKTSLLERPSAATTDDGCKRSSSGSWTEGNVTRYPNFSAPFVKSLRGWFDADEETVADSQVVTRRHWGGVVKIRWCLLKGTLSCLSTSTVPPFVFRWTTGKGYGRLTVATRDERQGGGMIMKSSEGCT